MNKKVGIRLIKAFWAITLDIYTRWPRANIGENHFTEVTLDPKIIMEWKFMKLSDGFEFESVGIDTDSVDDLIEDT